LLLNVALHGLEEAAGVRYQASGRHAGDTSPGCPVVVRYADDPVACCRSRQQAEQVKAQPAEWLAPRGLVFNEDKTKIVHLTEGFDFLGFNVRRYRNGKLLIKPGTTAVKRIRKRLATEMRALRGSNAAAVIARLNPIIRGWAAYYRGWCPARFSARWTTTCGNSPTERVPVFVEIEVAVPRLSPTWW
jgi:RNA-directed DNA polymerase